jgi:uroporphyrinogen III methyltransferase/synthase
MSPGKVYLVGAGPGHPGYLTLRGLECLRQADFVLYDKLVSQVLLEYAPPAAQRLCVTELAEHHVERYVPVHRIMIEAATQGRIVVRLKGGDPFLFGRGGEEAEVLRQAGIAYEIVPGVTAALGAAACTGIPLTHRLHASAVAFVTGHEQPGKPESSLDWPALAAFRGTLVFYMGISRLTQIVRALIEHGKAPDTPAAVVHWATTGEQRTIENTLDGLADAVLKAGITAPAVVIIGPVVSLRKDLTWFEDGPLFGKRVLVTRPRQQTSELVNGLILLGAVPYVLPAVEIREPADWGPVDRALARLASYHWLVFTSVNGVEYLLGRLPKVRLDLRALAPVRLAAIGPKTADALRRFHLEPDVVPARFQSEDLAAELRKHIQPGQRVLLARADRGRDLLRAELSGIAEVDQIAAYSQVDAIASDSKVLDHLRRGEIDYVTLTSSNIARALLASVDEPSRARLESGQVKLVSISPVTSAAVTQLGLKVAAEASEATTESLLEALVRLAKRPLTTHHSANQHSPPVFERVPGQVQNNAAGNQTENIDHPTEAAEGYL